MTDTYTPVLTNGEIETIEFEDNGHLGAALLSFARAIERAAIETYQRQQWRPIETAPKGE